MEPSNHTPVTSSRTITTSASSSSNPPHVERKAKKTRSVTNLAVRTLTIVTLGPLIVAVGLHSNFGVTCLSCIGCTLSGLEWHGLKRHLKASLLLPDSTEEEYPVPAPEITPYVLLKHAFWGAMAWVPYYWGFQGVVIVIWLYALVIVVATLVMHDQIGHITNLAWHRHAQPSSSSSPSLPTKESSAVAGPIPSTTRIADTYTADPALSAAERFFAREQFIRAHMPLADRVLDVCLDVFGLVWVSLFMCLTLLYDAPFVGKSWILSTTIANFANDIAALVTGRTLATMRSAMRDADERHATSSASVSPLGPTETAAVPDVAEERQPRRGALTSLILAGPHPLSPSISPNKSVEGAVAGVVANALVFTVCMRLSDGVFFPATPAQLVHPVFRSVPFYLVVGTLLGGIGVLGDLLESLLKRVALVKDAGFIIPGHGGVLDRFDGLLLAYTVMLCLARAVEFATSHLVLLQSQ